jgi:tRNA dimethylallyltransferase
MTESKPLLAVIGPTGSGKSELALFLAERLEGEIVNTDSLQLYRGFDIGTAKTPLDARRGIPHHLLDLLEPAQCFSAGEFARRARAAIEESATRGKLPVLVGGAGFYLRALLEGLFPGPASDAELRERLRNRAAKRPPGYLHGLLRRLDPLSAARIHPHDTPKLIRAIEVCLHARRPMSALFRESRGHGRLEGFQAIKIGLNPPRHLLYARINQRAARMFEAGLVEEVRALLAAGLPPDAKPFESVGYKEALAVVQGAMGLEQAIAATQLRSRRYAKRQMTWFRRESGVRWLAAFGDDPAAQEQAYALFSQRRDAGTAE